MGTHYPKAVFNLMLGIYCLELCMIGLFIMARDSSGKQICIVHTVVMVFLLVCTGIYHHRLCCIFKPIITYIPVSLGNLSDEPQEKRDRHESELHGGAYTTGTESINGDRASRDGHRQRRPSLRSLSAIFRPQSRHDHLRNEAILEEPYETQFASEPFPKHTSLAAAPPLPQAGAKADAEIDFFDGIDITLEHLTPRQRAHLVSRAFHHVAVRTPRPCIWIPRDKWGVALDQMEDIRLNYPHILVSCDGCGIDDKGKLVVRKIPPDYDPTGMMRL